MLDEVTANEATAACDENRTQTWEIRCHGERLGLEEELGDCPQLF